MKGEAATASFHLDIRSRHLANDLATAVTDAWTKTDVRRAQLSQARLSATSASVAGKTGSTNKKASEYSNFKKAEACSFEAYLQLQKALSTPLPKNNKDAAEWVEEFGSYARGLCNFVVSKSDSLRADIASETRELTK